MLKFGGFELQWDEIASVNIADDANEVNVVTTSNELFVVGNYPFASDAATIKNLIDNGRQSNSIGGVVIEVIIDDLRSAF